MKTLKIKIIDASQTFTGHSDGDIVEVYENESDEYGFEYVDVATGHGFQKSFLKDGVIEIINN